MGVCANADWVEFVVWVETGLRIGGELRFAKFKSLGFVTFGCLCDSGCCVRVEIACVGGIKCGERRA